MKKFTGRIGISKEERVAAEKYARRYSFHTAIVRIKRGGNPSHRIMYILAYDKHDILYRIRFDKVMRMLPPTGNQVDSEYKLKYFLHQAEVVHGDKYDYSLIKNEDIKWQKKLPIVCNKKGHGTFMQTKSAHITDRKGCPVCGNLIFKRFHK